MDEKRKAIKQEQEERDEVKNKAKMERYNEKGRRREENRPKTEKKNT